MSNIQHVISSLAEAIVEIKHSAYILKDVLWKNILLKGTLKLDSVKLNFADSVNHLAIVLCFGFIGKVSLFFKVQS